jgi:hypothetical protein
LLALQQQAKTAYDTHFSREIAIAAWDRLLRSAIDVHGAEP